VETAHPVKDLLLVLVLAQPVAVVVEPLVQVMMLTIQPLVVVTVAQPKTQV
tara:strand:- start:158 stop:310 length:153 start_codon:yes stop_codon:yes gene_type:complete